MGIKDAFKKSVALEAGLELGGLISIWAVRFTIQFACQVSTQWVILTNVCKTTLSEKTSLFNNSSLDTSS